MTSEAIAYVSAWLVVVVYVVALVSEFRRWDENTRRLTWAAGAVALLGHMLWTMLVVHHGSMQVAFDHTGKKTEQFVGIAIGAGLYINFAMLAAWLADAAAWAFVPKWGSFRQTYLLPMHLSFGFLFFNAAIVFASWGSRLLGIAALVIVIIAWLLPSQARLNAPGSKPEQ